MGLPSYEDFVLSLGDREYFGQRLGLDRIREVLSRLGNPQDKFPSIHIAGTNGKGSTAAMIASVLEESGLRVGLFTSPHLEDFCERIQVWEKSPQGRILITPEDVLRYETEISRAASAEDPLTFFEVSAAMAFLHFEAKQVDVAVLETGLGGRLDATNVVTPAVSVITTIGLDHMAHLGNTIGAIAREKAGIIKPGVPVVIGRMPAEAKAVLVEVAHQLQAPLTEVQQDRLPDDWQVGLAGEHQRDNAALALTVIDIINSVATGPVTSENFFRFRSTHPLLGPSASLSVGVTLRSADKVSLVPPVIKLALSNIHWPGRLETVSEKPWILLDGAHNPQAMKAVREHLEKTLKGRKLIVLFGAMADKDIAGMLRELAPVVSEIVVTAPPLKRAANPDDVGRIARGLGFRTAVVPDVFAACESIRSRLNPDDALLMTGSFFLVGEVRKSSFR